MINRMLPLFACAVCLLCVLGGCKKKSAVPVSSDDISLEETSGTLSSNSIYYNTDEEIDPNELPCVRAGLLPLSRGLVGEIIMTAADEVRLYRPTDPNTSSGINYGQVWISVPEDGITSIPMTPRMYRNELIAKLPKAATLPAYVVFEARRLPSGSETLPYIINDIEPARETGSTRKDVYAFSLKEEMDEAYIKLKEVIEADESLFQIEIASRLLADQSSRYLSLTKDTLNTNQQEAAKLLHQTTAFILECCKDKTKADFKTLMPKVENYLSRLSSASE